jgi:hypothetical protein
MSHPIHAQPYRAVVTWPHRHLVALLVTAAIAIAALSAARTEAAVSLDAPWPDRVAAAAVIGLDAPWLDHVAAAITGAVVGLEAPWLDHVAAANAGAVVGLEAPWLDHLPAATPASTGAAGVDGTAP